MPAAGGPGTQFASLCLSQLIFAAEKNLSQAQKTTGHPLQVLQIVANATPAESAIQQAAAVHFKNVVKKGWDTSLEVSCLV